MEHGERPKPNQIVAVEQFGAGLAAGAWTFEGATLRLCETLLAIGCDARLIGDDLTELATEATDKRLEPADPAVSKFIKITTRSILFREDPDSASMPPHTTQAGELYQKIREHLGYEPEETEPTGHLDIDKLAADSTEGILWVDPEEEKWRDKMTTRSAELLRALIDSMGKEGYPRATVKDVVREEIDNNLDYLASKTSYAAFGALPVLATIQTKARLHNLRTSVNWVKRVGIMRHAFKS